MILPINHLAEELREVVDLVVDDHPTLVLRDLIEGHLFEGVIFGRGDGGGAGGGGDGGDSFVYGVIGFRAAAAAAAAAVERGDVERLRTGHGVDDGRRRRRRRRLSSDSRASRCPAGEQFNAAVIFVRFDRVFRLLP